MWPNIAQAISLNHRPFVKLTSPARVKCVCDKFMQTRKALGGLTRINSIIIGAKNAISARFQPPIFLTKPCR